MLYYPTEAIAALTEVIRVSAALLTAISARDTAMVRPLLVPGALFVSVSDPAAASAPAGLMTDAEFYRTLPLGKSAFSSALAPPAMLATSPSDRRRPR